MKNKRKEKKRSFQDFLDQAGDNISDLSDIVRAAIQELLDVPCSHSYFSSAMPNLEMTVEVFFKIDPKDERAIKEALGKIYEATQDDNSLPESASVPCVCD